MNKTLPYISLYENSKKQLKLRSSALTDYCWNFIVIGDSHLYTCDNNRTKKFTELLHRISQKEDILKPLFILHVGDTIHKGRKYRLENFKNVFMKNKILSKIPIFVTIGNHDHIGINGSTKEFEKYIGPCEYTFDIEKENTRFICLNNTGYFNHIENKYEIGFTKNYLDKYLKFPLDEGIKKGMKHFFISMHIPPKVGIWFNNTVTSYHTFENGFENFMEIVTDKKYKHKINGVFSGHIHSYGLQYINGIPFISTGGAGGYLNRRCYPKINHHFLYVKIYKNNLNRSIGIFKYDI